MRPSELLDANRQAIRDAVARRKFSNPRVFGSVLHGTDREGSDIDLLIDDEADATLFDLGGLSEDLRILLGVHVDLLTPAALPKKFRDEVLAEAKPI